MTSKTSARNVIVVGAGLSGLATALGAALLGHPVTVLEAADMVGGAAAYSGGQVWVGANHVAARQGIDDDLARAERYVRALAQAKPEFLDETAMRRWLQVSPGAMRYWEDIGAVRWTVIPGLIDYHPDADGALGVGRYLTADVVDGTVLGEWRRRLRVSPYFPVGTTYAEMAVTGRRVNDRDGIGTEDRLTFGTGLVASFLARVLREQNVRLQVGHRVTELLRGDGGGGDRGAG